MNYNDLKYSMPDAAHFYYGVDSSVLNDLPAPVWWGQFQGQYYCGTIDPVASLASLEVLPA